jgi:glyoxalase family protein
MMATSTGPLPSIAGIHHVTAMASDPQRNVDFYTRVLGLRLVKRTVNFDDPGTYHLYYGDVVGHPGTILTFFPWPSARRGRHGAGQATATAYGVPAGSLGFWSDRLIRLGVVAESPEERWGRGVLTFLDPDGLKLELVEGDGLAGEPWEGGGIPDEQALHAFAGVTLTLWNAEGTAKILTETLGFRLEREEKGRIRFVAGADGRGSKVDLLVQPTAERGTISAGAVHHVAFRATDEADQLAWRARVEAAGLAVTPVLDRQYFRSIYFREPGGVLFEIATDPPGFTRDETRETLGTRLLLPPWLEAQRAEIESALPPIEVPAVGAPAVAGESR